MTTLKRNEKGSVNLFKKVNKFKSVTNDESVVNMFADKVIFEIDSQIEKQNEAKRCFEFELSSIDNEIQIAISKALFSIDIEKTELNPKIYIQNYFTVQHNFEDKKKKIVFGIENCDIQIERLKELKDFLLK